MQNPDWCESLTWKQGVLESLYEADGHLAYLFTNQVSNYSAAPSGGQFSFAMVAEMLDKIYHAPIVVHGSEQNPHLYHPNPRSFWFRFCSTCGFPRDEEAAQVAIEVLRKEMV